MPGWPFGSSSRAIGSIRRSELAPHRELGAYCPGLCGFPQPSHEQERANDVGALMSARPRAIRRRAKRLYGYWRAEQRTLRQGLVALALSTVAGFVAGLTLSGIGGTLQRLPGLLVLMPAAVGMRGTIFGAIGARLGTTINAGQFEPSLRRKGFLGQNVQSSWYLTLATCLFLGPAAHIVAIAFGARLDLGLEPRDHLRRGGRARVRVHPARDGGAVGPVPSPSLGPGLGLDAHRHGDRRHGHAAGAVARIPGGPASSRSHAVPGLGDGGALPLCGPFGATRG